VLRFLVVGVFQIFPPGNIFSYELDKYKMLRVVRNSNAYFDVHSDGVANVDLATFNAVNL